MPDTPRTEQLRRKIAAMRAGKIPQDEALELAVISHLKLERELAQARQDGIEEGRRQMREEAAQVCNESFSINGHVIGTTIVHQLIQDAILKIPVKKELT